MIKKCMAAVGTIFMFLVWLPPLASAEMRVVATIKPIHSLVASLMDGIGQPELIVKGFASPHGYSMKPSDARLFENADLIVWVGSNIESSLSTAIATLPQNGTHLELSEISGLKLYEYRTSHIHDHHDEEHEEEEHHAHEEADSHDEHEHHDDSHAEDEDSHGHETEGHHQEAEHAADDHDDERHDEGHYDDHHHSEFDLHVWLDVNNVKLMSIAMARALIEIDPQFEKSIQANLGALLLKLDELGGELENQAKSIADRPYIVFHDAYQYFERWLKLNSVAAVTLNPEIIPGVRQINELREVVHDTNAVCAFAEPQFNPRILHVVNEGIELKIGMLDPLGAEVEAGPDAYFDLMRNMISALSECLT